MSKDKKKLIQGFNRFLKEVELEEEYYREWNNPSAIAWRKYIRCNSKTLEGYFKAQGPHDWISRAFDWSNSESGDDFWQDLSMDWSEIMDAYDFRYDKNTYTTMVWKRFFLPEINANTKLI